MANIKGVITADGEGFYVTDGKSESEACDWGVVADFNDKRYLGETDGEVATLSLVTAIDAEWEEEDDDDQEGVASAAD